MPAAPVLVDLAPFSEIRHHSVEVVPLNAHRFSQLGILTRVAAIDEVAKALPHEPDAAEVVAKSERLRRERYQNAVVTLADRFGLRDDLGIDRATDLLLMFGSSATYLTLRRYGWSDDDYVAWATDTLSKQLLARPGRT